MADAAEEVAGLPDRAIRLKWPNDLVIETDRAGRARSPPPSRRACARWPASSARRTGSGTDDPRVVVGLGIDTDWAAADFPPELADTMTSLREAAHGRPIDHVALLDAFLGRLEVRIEALRGGRFDVGDWTERQLTTGRDVTLIDPDGAEPDRPRPRRRCRERRARRRGCRVGRRRAGRRRRRDPPRPAGAPTDRSGCNAMARPALGRVARPEEAARPRLAHLDRDRALVEAAQADPARFDALYRKYVAQVYSYAVYELRDQHEAEDATARTFLSALADLPRFEERAMPADGEGASTFRVWLFQIARNAIAERRRTTPPTAAGRRSRPPWPCPHRSTSRATRSCATRPRRPGGPSPGSTTTAAGRSSCASSTS